MTEIAPTFDTQIGIRMTEDTTPAEPNSIPSSLVNLVDTTYTDVMTRLLRGETFKRRGITTRPTIYLCKLDDLGRFRNLIADWTKDDEINAMYNNLSHAIYLPVIEVVNSLSSGADHARQLVYEEMIHALTSYYDPDTRISQHGFQRKRIESEDSHQRRIKARLPRETWEFYDWRLASQVSERNMRPEVKNGDDVLRNIAATENTTSLIRYLLTMPDDREIVSRDFSAKPPKTIAVAAKESLIEIYQEISGGGDLTSELLDILASGEELALQRLVGLATIINLKPAGLRSLKKKVLVKGPKLYSLRRILETLTKPECGIEVVKSKDFIR